MEKQNKRLKLLCVLLAAMLVVSLFAVGKSYFDYKHQRSVMNNYIITAAREAAESLEKYFAAKEESDYDRGAANFSSMNNSIAYMYETASVANKRELADVDFAACSELVMTSPEAAEYAKTELFDYLSCAEKFDGSESNYAELANKARALHLKLQNYR